MSNFKIDGKILNYGKFWYHYKNPARDIIRYEFSISYSETQLINIIEKYSKKKMGDKELASKIIEKDLVNGSMGLFWYIFQYLEHNSSEKETLSWDYVINNIKGINFSNDEIVIFGDATLWKEI